MPWCGALNLLQKPLHYRGVNKNSCPAFVCCGPWPSCYSRPRLIHEVLDRGAHAVVRGGARCASQVLGRGAQADARGATHLLDRGVQAVARGAARCALHVNGIHNQTGKAVKMHKIVMG